MLGDSSRNILQQGSFTVTGSPAPPPPLVDAALRINAGGGAVTSAAWFPSFSTDTGFTGGTVAASAASIDLTGVSNPAPPGVYQSNRGGTFSYTLPMINIWPLTYAFPMSTSGARS